jgi:hypothetical protein
MVALAMAELTASGSGGHAASMHEQLARIYHLVRRIAVTPLWRAPVVAFGVGLLVRLAPARAAVGAVLAVLAGWLAQVLPLNPFTAAGPVARLPGAAVLLALYIQAARGRGPVPGWLALPLYGIAAAWWLRDAPLNGPAIANLVPVILGLVAAAALGRRMAAKDAGTTTIAAAVALAAALEVSGAAPHWSRAALAPAAAGVALLGLGEAVAPLAQAIVLVAVAAVAASNRGRFVPVDLAAAAPFLVWWLAPRLLPRLNRAGPALAAGLAAVCGVGLVWGAMTLLNHR